MQKVYFLSVLLVLVLCFPSFAQSNIPSITKMGNGLTVILQEDHAADLIGIDIWVKAGSANETPQNNGVSHFIEHLLFSSTVKRKPGDMDREMESLGATLDARTSNDWAHFSTTISSRYLSKALDIFADAVNGSQFLDSDIDRERMVILDEIASKENDPRKVCRDLLAKEIYNDHPYALPVEGNLDAVKNIKRQDILDYVKKYYVPGNMAIVLVGDFDKQAAISEIGRLFQGGSSKPPELPSPAVKPISAQVNKSIKLPFDQTYIAIGFLGPSGNNYDDVCATDVLFTYIGFGYHSWMNNTLKEKLALVNNASADFLTHRQQAVISIIASASSANISKVQGAIFAKLATLRTDGITQTDLDFAKRSLLGQFAFQNETFGGRADSYGFYYAVSDPAFASKYIDSVQAVTRESILRVAQKYLDPNSAVILIVGPDQGGSQ